MSERILPARAVTENGVLLAPFEKKSFRDFERKRRRARALRMRRLVFFLRAHLQGFLIYCARIQSFPRKRKYAQIGGAGEGIAFLRN